MGWQVAQETWPLADSFGSLNKARPWSIRALLVWEAAGSGNASKAATTTRRFIAISIPFCLFFVDLRTPRRSGSQAADIICIYKYIRTGHPSSSGGNDHAVRLLHPERQPLSQQSADGRGL